MHIPKGDGSSTRPIGIPTFEDKVLQRAVAMVLEAIYEEDFYDFSYGFRPGRSAHLALESLQDALMKMTGGWVLEVDIRKFFDTLDHERLRDILRRRVGDGVVLRLIGKWLNAGVLEDLVLSHPETGTPQGGVISPLLANIYLHAVLDEWFVKEVQPRLKGRSLLIRYADDFVLVFQHEKDARRVFEVLPKRFGQYSLTLHPEKTRLLLFRRPTVRRKDDEPPLGTFDLLGFTHYWGRSLKGRWYVKRRTAKDRFSRALRRVREWCRTHLHEPVKEQWQALRRKLSGHYAYYGVTSNYDALTRFLWEVRRIWWKWLSRRSNKAVKAWAGLVRLEGRFPLPLPKIRPPVRHVA